MKKLVFAVILSVVSLFANAQVNTDRVMTIGKHAVYFEDYVLAIQYFNQVIGAKPYLAEPFFYRGMAKFMLDDFKGAEEDCTSCLERNPYYTAAFQLRGAARQNQEKYELAVDDYRRSLEFFPEDQITLVNMGIVNMELKEYAIAEKFFDALLRRFPNYAPGYLTRAQLFLETNDTVKAMKDYNKAIEVDPYTSQSFAARGLLYLQQNKYQKALDDLNEAIRIDPYFEGNYINRGLIKYNLNDLRGAMDDYNKVIEMEPSNLIARFNRGLLRAQVADNNRAIEDFDNVILQEPTNTIAYLNRAILKNEIGDKHGAMSDLNVVLKKHPDYFSGYYMRSQLKREAGDLSGAEKDFMLARAEENKAKKRAVSRTEAEKIKTIKEKKNKDTREETDKDIEKFNLLVVADKEDAKKSKYQRESRGKVQNRSSKIELEPRFVLTYYEKKQDINRPVYYSASMDRANRDLGLTWILKASNNDASLNELQIQTHFRSIHAYTQKINAHPNDASLYFGRAMDYVLVQDYENALSDLNQAIAIKKDFMLAYFARAITRSKQVEFDPQNDKNLTLSHTVQPDVPFASGQGQNKISAIKNDFKPLSMKPFEYDAIMKDYETVLRLDPHFSFAYYNRAEFYSREKNYKAAIEEYTKAIEEQPQFAEAYFNRGIARLFIGDTESGLDDLRKAGELGVVAAYSIIKRMQ